MLRKTVIGGVFFLGVLIFGFVMLFRSCLSKYDERYAISTPLVVEKDGKTVVLSLVKFEKATNYNRENGIIHKSVSVSYYVQSNDGITGSKLQSKKIKKARQVKTYPVEMLGISNNVAWLFASELIAIDPFTLEIKANAAAIEAKNPSLKGKLSMERRHYEYDHEYGIRLLATDGTPYLLNTSTLIATVAEEEEKDPGKARKKEFEKFLASTRKLSDSNYSRFRAANKLYSERKISQSAYQDSSDRYARERRLISQMEDSIRELAQNIDDEIRAARDEQQLKNSLKSNVSFSQIKANMDSFRGKWYGLLTSEELEKLWEKFDYRKFYGDAGRNKLYTASLSQKDPSKKFSDCIIGEEREKLSDAIFLQGGFLLDIETGRPVHLTGPDSYIVIYKEQVGNEAKILLSRVGIDGKQNWSLNTGLKEFSYWTIYKQRLYVFGTDNKELSSDEINVLHIIDLSNGSFVTHDYFRDKDRSTKK